MLPRSCRRTKISEKSDSDDETSKVSRLRQQVLNSEIRRKVRLPKLPVWVTYAGIFVIIISIVALGYHAPQDNTTASVADATTTPEVTPTPASKLSVDKLVSTDVAYKIAEQTHMAITNNLSERVITLSVESDLAQTDTSSIVKPQIIQPTASSRDVVNYKVKKGDTLGSIAAVYGISKDTIKWANNMSGDSVKVGSTLKILPVDGVLYKVKSGDSIDKLAKTYSANKERIVSFNDLEISGLVAGQTIIIPDGNKPKPVVTNTFQTGGSGGFYYSSRGSGYAYGYCTYYAAARRAEMGRPIPGSWGNASSWAWFAAKDGFSVGSVPKVGAIMQSLGGYGGLGHVAIVEEVKANGDIVITEMNGYRFGGGWGRVGRGTIPKSQTYGFNYIY